MGFQTRVAQFSSHGSPVFQEEFGLIVIDAAQTYQFHTKNDGSTWARSPSGVLRPGFSGDGFVQAQVTGAANASVATGSQVLYRINVREAATFRIWLRRWAPAAAQDSVFVKVDGVQVGTVFGDDGLNLGDWVWKSVNGGGTNVALTAGEHTIEIVRREEGYALDQILLWTDLVSTPSDEAQTLTPQKNQGSGWQIIVQRMNDFFRENNILFKDLDFSTKVGTNQGIDSITAFLLFLDLNQDADNFTAPTLAAQYNDGSISSIDASYPTWFAADTDAGTAARKPIFVGTPSTVTSNADTQTGKQALYIYTDKSADPHKVLTEYPAFIGDPVGVIAPGASGNVALETSDGASVGTFSVLNLSTTDNWNPGEPSYVTLDIEAGVSSGHPRLVAIPSCC